MKIRRFGRGGLACLALSLWLLSSQALGGGTDKPSRGKDGCKECVASTENPKNNQGKGVMHYGLIPHSGDLRLWDEPLSYTPAYGPSVSLTVSLNPTQAAQTTTGTNFGGWGSGLVGYVTTVPVDPMHPDGGVIVYGTDGGFEDYVPAVREACSATSTMRCEYPAEGISKNELIRWGGDARAWEARDATVLAARRAAVPLGVRNLARDPRAMVRVSPSGTYEVYGGRSDAIRMVPGGQELWLSALVDRNGMALRWYYETVDGVLRITDIGDATIESTSPPIRDGGGHIVSGSSRGWVHVYYADTDPRYQEGLREWVSELTHVHPRVKGLVTALEDPYGHQAQFEYQDALTGVRLGVALARGSSPEQMQLHAALRDLSHWFRLVTSRDVIGVESTIQYQYGSTRLGTSARELADVRSMLERNRCLAGLGFGQDGLLVAATVTPHGMTKYRRVFEDNGAQKRRGWVVINPVGGAQRLEAVFGTMNQSLQMQMSALVGSRPALRPAHVPARAWELLLERPSTQYRVSLYWSSKAMWDLLNPTDVAQMPPLDHAHIRQWLHDYPVREGQATQSPVLAWEKRPLQGGVYYAYPGMLNADTYRGSTLTGETSALNQPMLVARTLDDGSTQATYISYNEKGLPQVVVDANGRATESVYADNQIDVTDVHQVSWDASRVTTLGRGNEGAMRLARLSHYQSNERGQVTRVEGASMMDGVTYEYETAAPYRLRGITSALGHTSLEWSVPYWTDPSIRVDRLTVVGADGLVSTRDYQQGHLIQIRSAGRTRSWGDFDALGRAGNASVDGELKLWYGYRGLDLVSIQNVIDHSELRIEPDFLGRPGLTQLIDRHGVLTQQSYRSYDASGGLSTLWSGIGWGEFVGFDYDIEGRVQKRIDTDGSSQELRYERNTNRVHGVRDARGIWTYLTYDAANALTDKRMRAEDAAPVVSFRYDRTYSRLNQRIDRIGTTQYHYDPIQPYQLSSMDEPLPRAASGARTVTTAISYDRLDRNTGWSVTDDASGIVQSMLELGFDDGHQGRIHRVTTEIGVATAHYDGMDNVTQFGELSRIGYELEPHLMHPAAVQTIDRSDAREDRRVNGIVFNGGETGEVLSSSRLSYDAAGRVRHIEGLTHGGIRDYTFDERSELTRASLWRNDGAGLTHQHTQRYGYDEAGNRRDVLEEAPPGLDGASGAILSTLRHAQYGASNRITQFTQAGMTQMADHDAAGNLTRNPAKQQTYTWDDEGRLIRIDYQGKGQQTKSSGATLLTYDGVGQIRRIQELDGMGVTTEDWSYIWVGNQLTQKRYTQTQTLAQTMNTDGYVDYHPDGTRTKYLLLKDYLGSVIGKTDSNGRVLERIDYDPWGEVENRQVTDPSGALQDTTDHIPSTPFTYAGYWSHPRSGLSLTRFRQYDPTLGRWLSKDPIAEIGGINLYAYVANSTVNAIDPLGLIGERWFDGRLWNAFKVLTKPLPRPDDCRGILEDLRQTIDQRDGNLVNASIEIPNDAEFDLVAAVIRRAYDERIGWLRRNWQGSSCGNRQFPRTDTGAQLDQLLSRRPLSSTVTRAGLVPTAENVHDSYWERVFSAMGDPYMGDPEGSSPIPPRISVGLMIAVPFAMGALSCAFFGELMEGGLTLIPQ